VRTEIRTVDPRQIKLLDTNARFMRYEQYQRLVDNVRRDGRLTSVPFCWEPEPGLLEVLSGNHRVQAAVDAELPAVEVMVSLDPLSPDERLGIQLSHNSIAGEDDPATLRMLYDSISTVELRDYAGLDDKTLDLLAKVEVGSLSEANLDFASVQLVFLPPELDTARDALEQARKLQPADETWLAAIGDHSRTLDAIEAAQQSYKVGNVATALHLVLAVFENHLTDLADGYTDQHGDPRHTGWVPLSTVLGTDQIPAAVAVVLNRAIDALVKRGDVPAKQRWLALELLAADTLAGPHPDGFPLEG
jgi:hypothetical protein